MMRFIIASLTLFMMPLSLMADNFLSDDQSARDYCNTVLSRSDEAYAQDTASVNQMLRDAEWIESEVLERYVILTTFCEKQLQRRHEAQQRVMPEGQLVSFSYREYGSSRPTTVEYALVRDVETSRWTLNGYEVADTVAAGVRALVEHHKTYQCLSRYDEAPSFPQAPPVMGGPPSWEFICRFEEGAVITGSESKPVPESCSLIVSYLSKILKELCKNQTNQ